MAVVELTLLPIASPSTSVSKYVAEAYRLVKDREDIEVELTPMGTILVGDLDKIFPLIQEMQEAIFKLGIDRVYSLIKIDDRRDKDYSISDKVKSVIEKQ